MIRHLSIPPSLCIPPHKVNKPEMVTLLAQMFRQSGWDMSEPALVGYAVPDHDEWGFKIQLLSGTHRHAAAVEAGINIPLTLLSRQEVNSAWGDLERWTKIMQSGNRQNENL